MFELIQLQQLVSIAKNGTLVAASEELAISQSALTRSIQRLEYELGAELFDRQKNKVTLNDAGKLAVAQAEQILASCDSLRHKVKKVADKNRTVSIGTVAPAPIWILEENETDATKKICSEKFNGRKIEYEVADEKDLLLGFEKHKYEFIILPYSVNNSPIEAHAKKYKSQKICEEHLCFSLAKNHKFAKRKRLHFSDMNGENFIVFSDIGFWDKVHRDNLPDSKFLVQNDKFTLEELTQNSALPHFVTDLSIKHFNRPVKNKSVISIVDKAAHAEFFLWGRVAQ